MIIFIRYAQKVIKKNKGVNGMTTDFTYKGYEIDIVYHKRTPYGIHFCITLYKEDEYSVSIVHSENVYVIDEEPLEEQVDYLFQKAKIVIDSEQFNLEGGF